MEKQRFNLNDLMETVRNTGATSLSEVEYVIMETNGNVSVIPTAEQRPVSLGDIGIQSADNPILSYVIIDNGHINQNNLRRLGYNLKWLEKQLKKVKISQANEIFCMTADSRGKVIIMPNNKERNKNKK